jgi:hypothetical protein
LAASAAVILFGNAAIAGAAAATGTDTTTVVEVALSPGGAAVNELVLEAEPGDPNPRLSFFLRQTGSQAIEDATLSVASTQLDVSITIDGQDVGSIPADGGAVAAVVSVTGLDEPVDERLDLFVQAKGGVLQNVAVLHIVRSDRPALTIVEDGGSGLTYTQDRARFERDIVLRATTEAAVEARLSYRNLQDDSSRQTPLRVSFDGAEVASGSLVRVDGNDSGLMSLSADLPRAGTYRTTLSFRYGARPTTLLDVPVIITVTATQLTVVAEAVSPVHSTRGLGDSCPTARVSYRESGGDQIDLAVEVLDTLRDDNGTLVATEGVDVWVEEVGAEPTSSACSAAGTSSDESGEATQISIAPRASTSVRVSLLDDPPAGKYEVKLRAQSEGAGPVDAVATFLIRDPWIYAGLLILAGSLLSFLLKWWIGKTRGTLSILVDIHRLGARIDVIAAGRQLSDHERQVVEQVRQIVHRLANEVRDDGATSAARAAHDDASARIDELDEWIAVSQLATANGSSRQIDEALEAARVVMLRSDPLDDDARHSIREKRDTALFLIGSEHAARQREEIARLLDPQQPAPAGFVEADWRQQAAAMLQKLPSDQDVREHPSERERSNEVLAELLDQLSSKLADHLATLARIPQNEPYVPRLEQLKERLTSPAGPGRNQLDASLSTYRAVVAEYLKLEPELQVRAPGQMGGGGQARAVQAVTAPKHETVEPQLMGSGNADAQALRRRRLLLGGDILTFVVVSALVALLGTLTLYWPDNTWGSHLDWLTAFLWGMGLYQIAGTAASQSIEAAWKSFGSP